MQQTFIKCHIMLLPILSYIYWLINFNGLDNKSILTEGLVEMALFGFKNIYVQFNSNAKHQILRTTIGFEFFPP